MKFNPVSYDFPVAAVLPELAAALLRRRCAVLAAPPGTGKTTLVPPYLLDRVSGRILMLEPRRLAAKAAAVRIAAMLGVPLGGPVGYAMRGEVRRSADTRIEIVTEGLLVRRLQEDPELTGVDVVIFDEFHERSLAADLALALALDVRQSLRPELAILAMSATLDAARIAALLGDAPVIAAEGRLFPVAEHYGEAFGAPRHLPERAAAAVEKILARESGSLLVFLPGAAEIDRCRALLAGKEADQVEILPLYGNLDFKLQEQAIRPAPPGRRKVVLATNLAESSLTIDGVRVVLDAGYERRNRFDPGSGMSRLELVRISRASAIQRAGRAGRLEPGAVYRLYAESDLGRLPEFTPPEIAESDLAGLALELHRWGAAPDALRWLDPPPPSALEAAAALLRELGALDGENRLTPLGRAAAELPVHPRLAVMLRQAAGLKLVPLAAELAALLEERDILPPGASADLTERLRLLRRRPAACRRVVAVRDQLCRLLHVSWREQDENAAGLLLAFAFPDRIGRSRGKLSGSYLLSGGRGARLPEHDDLRRCEFLAVARLDRGEGEGRIQLAAGLTEEALRQHFAARITTAERVFFDAGKERLAGRREEKLGAVVLAAAPLGKISPEKAAELLAAAVRAAGLTTLEFNDSARRLLDRVRFAAGIEPAAWPDWSESALLDRLEELLRQLPAARAIDDLRRADWTALLKNLLGFPLLARLDREYPEFFTVPTGSKLRLDYRGAAPTLAVRVQELYGLATHPTLGHGRFPLRLELLSPARRPIQITSDLPEFWRVNWAIVRKEMRAAYPKHPWPENPAAAPPTTRAKPRGGLA